MIGILIPKIFKENNKRGFVALLVYLFFLGIPGIIVFLNYNINILLNLHVESPSSILFLNPSDSLLFLFILYVLIVFGSILSLPIFAYNLYYLKTEKEILSIYGILEIFIALCASIFIFLTISPYPRVDIPMLFMNYFIAIYAPAYIIVRGFESIGKKYKNEQGTVFWLKFGTNEEGKAIHISKKLLKPALFFEKQIKQSYETDRKRKIS